MDFFKGQKLKLVFDALDVTAKEATKVLYPSGTEVIITDVNTTHVSLEFPDSFKCQHLIQDVPLLFKTVSHDKPLYKVFKGIGTPPKDLFPYLPPEAKWDHNYLYEFKLTLIDQGRKTHICPDCYTELIGTDETLTNGIECPSCKVIKIPVSVESILPPE